MSWIKISNLESALFLWSKRYQNKQKTKTQLTTTDGKSCLAGVFCSRVMHFLK